MGGSLSRLLKNSHLAAILESRLVRRSAVYAQRVLRLRGAFCGCDDLTIFEQPLILLFPATLAFLPRR
jgi:hypothetical protein